MKWILASLLLTKKIAMASVQDISKAINSAEEALLLHKDKTSHFEGASAHFESMLDGSTKQEDEEDDNLSTLVDKMEDLIRQANLRQLEQLIEDLNVALTAESQRRLNKSGNGKQQVDQDIISMESLARAFDKKDLFQTAEQDIEGWIAAIINDQVDTVESQLREAASLSLEVDDTEVATLEDEHCVAAEKAADEVIDALTRFSKDGIGLEDHAKGATVIHEMTSPTYTPPPLDEDRLGHGRWRRFIPDDIEDWLPEGWQDWDVRLPSPVYHALGINGSPSATHGAFLHPDTQPGSCWPFAGSKGIATVQLPYTVMVESVSIDHVPKSLLMKDQDQSSAPRNIKVYGLPPCEGQCDGFDFDLKKEFLIGEVNYDIESDSSTQTFVFSANEDTKSQVEDEASCSVTAESCQAPGKKNVPVAAVRLEITSNWGNEEYTCLYRFRVHGRKVA